ncbi:hypothetical protein [Bradyrhizobium sp. 6(2017)]|uniref:hypothetical protein n=1 Tax=Bradyrhizobium sp. 6(2017) TaxID=1197460 RepID=UPI0013E1BAFD|nr:hypothetical protein [Bradyrhizobium sp. 6(2017)]QIG94427.1 hypothetical protein G6P99_19395 [Bradyrhizobium sp. 6(2017)]
MAKTTRTTLRTTTNIDALIERYDILAARLDALYKMEEDYATEAERTAIAHEAEPLAIQIIATEAYTRRAVDAKDRIATQEGFGRDQIVRRMRAYDLERIAARRRRPARTLVNHAAASA